MKLKNISLEYEDGSTKSIISNNLDTRIQLALADSGLCDMPSEISSAKYYLLLQWKDGWKEVLAINSDTSDLIRYYVIRRIEDRGRLALDVGAGYPELIIIKRLPMEVSHLLIVSDNSVKSYGLQSELEGYEGIFEAGGKKEYRKYDKANPYFKDEFSENHGGLAEVENSVVEALKQKNIHPNELLAADQNRRIQEYKDIARTAGIRGFKKQSDVYGLIELVLRNFTRKSE